MSWYEAREEEYLLLQALQREEAQTARIFDVDGNEIE